MLAQEISKLHTNWMISPDNHYIITVVDSIKKNSHTAELWSKTLNISEPGRFLGYQHKNTFQLIFFPTSTVDIKQMKLA